MLENKYRYANDKMRLVTKNIPKGKWRVWLKWSTKFALDCANEEEGIIDMKKALVRAET